MGELRCPRCGESCFLGVCFNCHWKQDDDKEDNVNEIDTTGAPVALPEDEQTRTYEYPLKCMNCGLYYSVYSWEKWADTRVTNGGYCPECGIGGNKVVYGPVEREEFIFQIVPGGAGLHGITPPTRVSPFGIMAPKLQEPE